MKSFLIKLTGIATLCLFSFALAQKPRSHQDKPYTPPDPWKGIPIGKKPQHIPEGMDWQGGWTRGDQPGRYSHWTAEKWTGSDEPFLAIRKKIDAQVKAGKKPMELVKAYKAEAKKEENIGNAKAQFAWAYAAFVAYQNFQKDQNFKSITQGIAQAMERPKSPKSYQYARMRAIFTHWDENLSLRHAGYLHKVVLRLTKRDPKDFSLKYIFAFDYAGGDDYELAMKWANEYRQAFPNKPASLFLLGRVYEGRFGILLSESSGRKAIDYFTKYIQSAPQTDSWRPAAQARIERTKQRMERFRKRGKLKA